MNDPVGDFLSRLLDEPPTEAEMAFMRPPGGWKLPPFDPDAELRNLTDDKP